MSSLIHLPEFAAFHEGLSKAPHDWQLRRVWADWLDDHDQPEAAARERALADRLEHPLTAEELAKLQADLDRANGKCRTRLLTLEQCLDCARAALAQRDRTYRFAGTGPGPLVARTLCLAALRSDGSVRIKVVRAPWCGNGIFWEVCQIDARLYPDREDIDRMVLAWADAG